MIVKIIGVGMCGTSTGDLLCFMKEGEVIRDIKAGQSDDIYNLKGRKAFQSNKRAKESSTYHIIRILLNRNENPF